jgi:hypothetical protein
MKATNLNCFKHGKNTRWVCALGVHNIYFIIATVTADSVAIFSVFIPKPTATK